MNRSITLNDLMKMFLQHIKLIVILTLVGGLIAFLYVTFMVKPVYSTSALILVQNEATFENEKANTSKISSEKVEVQNIDASQRLANTCAVLFMQDPDMKSIISGASVSIETVEDSYFLRISVSSSDPNSAANIANLLANTAPTVFAKYFGDAGKVDTVDEAAIPSSPSSPDKMKYVLVGLLVGLVLGLVISFLMEIVDTTIKAEDDLYKMYDIPVFAEIIDFDVEGGGKKR